MFRITEAGSKEAKMERDHRHSTGDLCLTGSKQTDHLPRLSRATQAAPWKRARTVFSNSCPVYHWYWFNTGAHGRELEKYMGEAVVIPEKDEPSPPSSARTHH